MEQLLETQGLHVGKKTSPSDDMVRDGSKKFIRMFDNSKVFLHLSVLGAEGLIPRISLWNFFGFFHVHRDVLIVEGFILRISLWIFLDFSAYIKMSWVLMASS